MTLINDAVVEVAAIRCQSLVRKVFPEGCRAPPSGRVLREAFPI